MAHTIVDDWKIVPRLDASRHSTDVSVSALVHVARRANKRTGWFGICMYGRAHWLLWYRMNKEASK